MLTREERIAQEEQVRACSVAVPEGYTGLGLAWAPDGARMYVTGPDLPALAYMGGGLGWQRMFEDLDG